ncbi:hypothetical protein GCM10011514_49560 [Emticicia aquatilis]|uniref:DinB family protein n=1 Tax=Emticicia aquatilis TaxID=1537369 RepID=A0A916Z753_9BACT|nr:hypothetical protein [Emticicia aquatilis]GGD79663.1 hypothetical protein GCM10011514_49560 [Emticicia aquatilis]
MIFLQLSAQLNSLSQLLSKLTNEQYSNKIEHLANSSIGSHTRHIVELVKCLVDGYQKNEIDYINRSRNLSLETDKIQAQNALMQLDSSIRLADKQLRVIVEESVGNEKQEVFTTFYREIIYNTEHTIHHLALIRVALIEMKLDLVDANFGIANSTIKYKQGIQNE